MQLLRVAPTNVVKNRYKQIMTGFPVIYKSVDYCLVPHFKSDVLKCLVYRYSVKCQRRVKKAENIEIEKLENFDFLIINKSLEL